MGSEVVGQNKGEMIDMNMNIGPEGIDQNQGKGIDMNIGEGIDQNQGEGFGLNMDVINIGDSFDSFDPFKGT